MRKIPALWRMTPGEYRANVDGLNLFFGAVLGVVMATTDRLGGRDFAVTLIVTATLVVTLLYVSSGRHRFAYALFAAAVLAFLPRILGPLLADPAGMPPHLQPTLLVWLGFIVLVELGALDGPPTDQPDA
jgi:hypothetical protein